MSHKRIANLSKKCLLKHSAAVEQVLKNIKADQAKGSHYPKTHLLYISSKFYLHNSP